MDNIYLLYPLYVCNISDIENGNLKNTNSNINDIELNNKKLNEMSISELAFLAFTLDVFGYVDEDQNFFIPNKQRLKIECFDKYTKIYIKCLDQYVTIIKDGTL